MSKKEEFSINPIYISKIRTESCQITGLVTKDELTVQGTTLKECKTVFDKLWETKKKVNK